MAVYFFRAYEQVQQDPLLCFMIAQAFFGRAMNRQSDNRNYQITQVGWLPQQALTTRGWRF